MKLCKELPKQNLILIQNILRIFDHILENHAPENDHIGHYYLTFFMAHHMLWPTHPCKEISYVYKDLSEYEKEMMTFGSVRGVVRLLIENSKSILDIR